MHRRRDKRSPGLVNKAFGIRFQPLSVSPGGWPALPDGTAGINMDAAIQSALLESPARGVATDGQALLPNVSVRADYGLFSHDRYGPVSADGQVRLQWQNLPAWRVTLSGAGVNAPTRGRVHVVHHEISVLIDAKTGKYLMAYFWH